MKQIYQKSDGQINVDKYEFTEHIVLQNIISAKLKRSAKR